MKVLEFGPFDKPIYRAEDQELPRDQPWCCLEGHPSPLSAAEHAALILAAEWLDREPVEA